MNLLPLLILVSSFCLLTYYYSNKIFTFSLLTLVFISILIFNNSAYTSITKLNEIEKIEQLKRANQYPKYGYRFANWIELRPESVAFFKLQNNFVSIFDLNNYFGGFKIIFLPFFTYGVFRALEVRGWGYLALLTPPLILLAMISTKSHSSFFALLPHVISSTIFGISIIFKKPK